MFLLFRSNVPAASSYGPGMYTGPPPSSAPSYAQQPQQSDIVASQANHMTGQSGPFPTPPSGGKIILFLLF